MIDISIVILTWNAKEVTEECLKSLENQRKNNYEFLLVDNASTDGSSEYLKKKFPWIKIIQNEKNTGYAGGNNLGVKFAKGKYVLVLSNDIVVAPNFLEEVWKNRNKADILGVKNYYYSQKDLIWAVGSKVNKWIMKASLVGNKLKSSPELDKTKIEMIVGSVMLINKKVIEKIGFLEESLFLYYEETEWQTRALKAGFKIDWIPSAEIWHKVATSSGGGRTPSSAYYLVRNRAYYIQKHSSHRILAYFSWIAEVVLRVLYGLAKRKKEYSLMSLMGARDFLKGKKGKYVS